MRLQVITLQDAPWPELVERWHRLEEMGVETIWVADHLGGSWSREQPWFVSSATAVMQHHAS